MDDRGGNSRLNIFWHHAKVYTYFISYHLLLPMPALFMIRYSLYYISVLGFMIFTSAIVLMF